MKRRDFCGMVGLNMLLANAAFAQSAYPDRPIKFIVPTSPGSGPDVLARGVGQLLSASMGQPVVIENRPGAAANIGFNAIAKAPADGYTIGIVPNQFSINPLLYKLQFDPSKDFEPLCLIAKGAMVLVTRPTLEVTDLKSFLQLARSKPGGISYASAGTGSPHHMAGALLESISDTKLLHVPYSGVAGAVTAVLGGEVDATFMAAQTAAQHVKSGRLRGLAVSTKQGSKVLPDMPSADSAGLPGFDVGFWFGLMAPVGIPPAVLQRIRTEVQSALSNTELTSSWAKAGLEPFYLPRAEFAAMIQEDLERWSTLIKRFDIKIE